MSLARKAGLALVELPVLPPCRRLSRTRQVRRGVLPGLQWLGFPGAHARAAASADAVQPARPRDVQGAHPAAAVEVDPYAVGSETPSGPSRSRRVARRRPHGRNDKISLRAAGPD